MSSLFVGGVRCKVEKEPGLKSVVGAGYDLHSADPDYLPSMTERAITDELLVEATHGIGPDFTRIGLIGEIGTDPMCCLDE